MKRFFGLHKALGFAIELYSRLIDQPQSTPEAPWATIRGRYIRSVQWPVRHPCTADFQSVVPWVIGGIGLFAPTLVLKFLGNRRKQQVFLGRPDALDLMVVCVEAGLGLDQAMRKVNEEMKKSYHVIAEEFSMCKFHLQMGRARNQVLQELGNRTGVDDLRALASILIQADKFGSSIATALRVQSDSMRVSLV
ncbi:MAG: type II secretion system F family protein [Pirellulaceae bacterium]|nr:type II secretion system F family protein [Pirellulaceae bacterium]